MNYHPILLQIPINLTTDLLNKFRSENINSQLFKISQEINHISLSLYGKAEIQKVSQILRSFMRKNHLRASISKIQRTVMPNEADDNLKGLIQNLPNGALVALLKCK